MASPPSPPNGRPDRTLRIVTIVAFVPALALLIPSGVVTAKPLPAIGLVPMAMSLVVSMAALGSKKSLTRMRPMADTIVATSLMIVMVFSWAMLAEDYWLSSGNAMLCAYGITPMMVNFCIHTYLALRALPSLFQPHPCPNCDYIPPSTSILPRWQRQQSHVALPTEDHDDDDDQEHAARHPQVQILSGCGGPGHSRSVKGIYQPPFSERDQGHEDAHARESSEFQTSGFNTPRQSAETLGSDVRDSSENSRETARRDGKGGSLV